MTLYHATLRENLDSIMARGIDPAFSKGKLKACWFHTSSKSAWAILHTQKRHRSTDIIIIEVEIPRAWITRRRTGLWSCSETVNAERFVGVFSSEEILDPGIIA